MDAPICPLTSPSLTPWRRLEILDLYVEIANAERLTIIKDLASADAARGCFCPPEHLHPTTIS